MSDLKPFDLEAAKSGALLAHKDDPTTPLHFLAINHTMDFIVCETRMDNMVQVRCRCDIKMFPRKVVKYGLKHVGTLDHFSNSLFDTTEKARDSFSPLDDLVVATVTWEE